MASLPRMRVLTVALCCALLVAACGSAEEPATTTTSGVSPVGPAAVVSEWLEAVIASDAQRLAELVDGDGLVILAAIENGFSEEGIAALLDEGMSTELVEEYWASFRAGFADFAGFPLRSIEVGSYEEFSLGEDPYAAVTISGGEGVTRVIASRREDRWRLDLIASFGPAFAAQLRRMLLNLSEAPAADRIRAAYRSDVVPGLLAALRRAPGNRVLAAELERMALLLER